MAKNNNLTDFVTDLANAIRAKCGTTGTINPQDFSKFVGGMPFFKFLRTEDITATSDAGVQLPLSYNQVYIKCEVYLTNDNGLTGIVGDAYAAVFANGVSTEQIFTINNTSNRIEISGYPAALPANYVCFFIGESDNGQSLIDAGWHIKMDIFEMCIGNPDGENTKIDLNNATGGGV